MRKIVTWIFAFVFAGAAPLVAAAAISRAIPSSGATNAVSDNTTTNESNPSVQARTTTRRDAAVEVSPATGDTVTRVTRSVSSGSNSTASRVTKTTVTATGADKTDDSSTVARTTTRGASDASRTVTPSRGAAARSAGAAGNTARDNLSAAVHTVGRNARVTAASVNSDPALRRAGISLRPSTAEVGGRAKIAGTNIQTGSNIGEAVRALQSRAASTTKNQRETIAEAKERLEQTADLNKSCQEQYNDCMDQFCAVIDSNQKRCSCSANLSRYTKVEEAVKDANNQLNEVAQRIRYVGLSADEIRAIMSATEAEEALSGARDTTETRNMLADIEDLIKNPQSSTSTVGTDSISLLDINLDFSNTTDLFNLDFLMNNNSSSLSNLRGTDLYNAAKKRCNSILTQCKEAGATQQQLTANYDLAIDKDCIAYEQGLNKMNETLVSNVRSANLMLQKARLAVLQNKNQYDAKGCIAALDACMTDDMVCGENYEKCLDPTKKYIDENGEVVIGENVTTIRNFMANYDNSKIDTGFLQKAAQNLLTDDTCVKDYQGNAGTGDKDGKNGDGWCTVQYLLQKIGTGVRATGTKNVGLCRAVLDKCQRYTYDNDKYQPYNDIVLNYIQRSMVNIKAGQEKAISEYASNCMVDVATCYNQQVTQVNAWTTSASVSSIRNVMRGACRNVALTCGYAVFDDCEAACNYISDPTRKDACTNSCPKSVNDEGGIIDAVSNMFYNSMLCPDNSTYSTVLKSNASASEQLRYVNDLCKCADDFEPYGGQCLAKCPTEADNGTGKRNSYGTCTCLDGYSFKNGACVQTGGTTTHYPCPANATEVGVLKTNAPAAEQEKYVTEQCKCADNFKPYGGKCLAECPTEAEHGTGVRDSDGTCTCESGYTFKNGACVEVGTPAGGGGSGAGDGTGDGSYEFRDYPAEDTSVLLDPTCDHKNHPRGCLFADEKTCTMEGKCACKDTHPDLGGYKLSVTTNASCMISRDIGAFSGTVEDCNNRLNPNETLNEYANKGYTFTYLATLSGTGQTEFKVPSQCMMKIQDNDGFCYTVDTWYRHKNANELGSDGYVTYTQYDDIPAHGPWLTDCETTPNSIYYGLCFMSRVHFRVGGHEEDIVCVRADNNGNLPPITDFLTKQAVVPGSCKFTGVFNETGDKQYYDENGRQVNPILKTDPGSYRPTGRALWKCD